MIFDNVVDDDGEPLNSEEESYRSKIYLELSKLLPNFDEFLFCEYSSDDEELPATRFYPHDKKVLIWIAGEKKLQQIKEIKSDFHHIFANYYWDEDNVTSIPLGYNYLPLNDNYIPVNERHFNISFLGALNKNRISMAAEITGINKHLLALGLHLNHPKTLNFLNNFLDLIKPDERYFFSWQFNSGTTKEKYNLIMKHTKIALAPKGWVNTETFRLYEAMMFGCVVVTNKLPKRKYYENIPVIQVDDWKNGFKEIKELLANENLMLELSEKSRAFYDAYLSPKATAKIIAEKLCPELSNTI